MTVADPTSPTFREVFERGRWDIDYFAEHLFGIVPHPGQSRFFRAGLMRNPSRWRAAYLTILVSAGNRAGKTLGLAIYIAHATLYKTGTKPPNLDSERSLLAWLKSPYDWWHFGLQGEVAELVHVELVRILTGTHPAQKGRGCPLVDMLGKAVADYTTKERGDYPWVRWHPALGGGEIHFRSTSEKALGSLGKEMNGLSWDEPAFSPDFEFIVNEVLHMRRLGTGGQMVLISTMTEGLTAFSDMWNKGDPEAPDRTPEMMSLRMSTRENIGYGLDQTIFDRLVASMPEYLIPQNIDGYAIEGKSAFFGQQAVDQMFTEDLPEETLPIKNRRYVQGVDPALTYDSTWAITLDMTNPMLTVGVRAKRKTGRQSVTSVASLVLEGHRVYNSERCICTTALDVTGFGGAAFRDVLSGIHPFRGVQFGGTKGRKTKLLLDLKSAIEKGRIRLPRSGPWLILRRQLLGYRLKDDKLETDAVMALAVAWYVVQREPGYGERAVSFDYFAQESTHDDVSSDPAAWGGRRVASTRVAVMSMGDADGG